MNQPNPNPAMETSPKRPNLSELDGRLKKLRLPVMRTMATQLADQAARENWSFLEYLSELTDYECLKRTENRIARHLKKSSLDSSKIWSAIRWNRLPMTVQQRMQQLQSGEFLKRSENLLIFGRPGSGKTMLLQALGDQLVRAGHPVCFAPCAKLVQHLLLAKRELRLPQMLMKLGRFSALIIDDLGYVQQSREEMEVLFTLIADRYERTSILLSSNLPFSKWEQIFKDPMTTAAAIDRLVHRSTILELNVPSMRLEEAKVSQEKQRRQEEASPSSPTGIPTNSTGEI
jgi:DNA replication protein DnaC